MALRPSQIRATSMDGALMIPGALGLRRHYDDLRMPVLIMAGSGDKVVLKRNAERLHGRIPGSGLRIVEGAGHMVHHSAPREVAGAVRSIAGTSAKLPARAPHEPATPLRAATEGLAEAA
jgi:pimeloyl-ACP methyl ester carboxylesterase